jgi:hypothetical protein
MSAPKETVELAGIDDEGNDLNSPQPEISVIIRLCVSINNNGPKPAIEFCAMSSAQKKM